MKFFTFKQPFRARSNYSPQISVYQIINWALLRAPKRIDSRRDLFFRTPNTISNRFQKGSTRPSFCFRKIFHFFDQNSILKSIFLLIYSTKRTLRNTTYVSRTFDDAKELQQRLFLMSISRMDIGRVKSILQGRPAIEPRSGHPLPTPFFDCERKLP